MIMTPIIKCSSLTKTYQDGTEEVQVLKGIDFSLCAHDTVAIMGASGSGKSSLMHLLAGIDSHTSGDVCLQSQSLSTLSDNDLAKIRNQSLGFIYQFHHLLPEMTAVENVAMPLLIAKVAYQKAIQKAKEALDVVGLSHRVHHKPSTLSGGERQRVAIARSVVHQPLAVLADEPTGNLDRQSADSIVELLLSLNQQLGMALVIVTHDHMIAERMSKRYHLENGVLQSV